MPVFEGFANGCVFLIHRSHFDRVGLFDTALPTTQDYDLWFRMFRGHSVVFLDGAYVRRRDHEKQGSKLLYHENERSQFWIKLMKAITDQECEALYGSRVKFYYKMYERFESLEYRDAAAYAKNKALNEIRTMKKQHMPIEIDFQNLLYKNLSSVEKGMLIVERAFVVLKDEGISKVWEKTCKRINRYLKH